MKNKDKAISFIQNSIDKNINERKWNEKLALNIKANHNIDVGLIMDILTKRNHPETVDQRILYCIIEAIDPKYLDQCFTDSEIRAYQFFKLEDESKQFAFPVIKISDDQYSGVISAEQLMRMGDLNLIHYNQLTQRPLVKKERGNIIVYSIDLNKQMVEDIYKAMVDEQYIPDTISFNIPLDSESTDESFSIAENETKLILDKQHVDIMDGFHRYMALRKAYVNKDEQVMGLNFPVNWTIYDVQKAHRFIWQEQQHYDMIQYHKDALNPNLIGAKVVDYLNRESILKSKLDRKSSKIDIDNIIYCINALFPSNEYGGVRELLILNKNIKDALESIFFEDENIEDDFSDEAFVIAFMYAFKTGNLSYKYILELRDYIKEQGICAANGYDEKTLRRR